MKIYAYYRVSGLSQDHDRQKSAIKRWQESKGVEIDYEVTEKISGRKNYKDRGLLDLFDKMSVGDMLVCADMTRVSRSGRDFSNLLHEQIIPRKLKLTVCSMGIDVDGADINIYKEQLLQNIAFAAQMELEFKSYQCAEGRNLQLQKLKEDGYYISKRSGERREQWGGMWEGRGVNTKVASRANHKAKQTWHVNSKAAKYVRNVAYGKGADEILMDLLEYVESDAEYSPRGKGEWNLAKVRRLQKVMLQWDVEIRMQYNIPYGKPIPVAVKYDLDCLDRAMRKYK